MNRAKTAQQPGRNSIAFEKNTLTLRQGDGKSVSVPIDRHELIDLCDRMAIRAGDKNRLTYGARLLESLKGSHIAVECRKSMQAAKSMRSRQQALETAILDLQRLPHPKEAAAGFAELFTRLIEEKVGSFE